MTPRLVMGLGLAALVSAGAAGAVWQAEHVRPVTREAGAFLLPSLADNVNSVAGIAVRADDKTLELKRVDDSWMVEPSGYPVKAGKLQQVLVGLVRMTKLEPRTASAEKYTVINVEDASGSGSKSRRVTLKNSKGDIVGDVILGKAAPGHTIGSEEAQYVRLAGDRQSWLVRGSVAAGGELKDWVDTTVMRINAGTVKQVDFHGPDGDVLTLSKAGKDDKGNDRFEIQGLPEGVKPKDELAVRYGATDLANVEFTDVRKAVGQTGATGLVLLTTDNGMKITYQTFEDGGQTWLRVAVTEKGSDADDADKIISRVGGWEFAVAEYKAKQFKKQLSDFLNMQQ